MQQCFDLKNIINKYCESNKIPLKLNEKPIKITPIMLSPPIIQQQNSRIQIKSNKGSRIHSENGNIWDNIPLKIVILTQARKDGEILLDLIQGNQAYTQRFKGLLQLNDAPIYVVKSRHNNDIINAWNNAISKFTDKCHAFIAILPYNKYVREQIYSESHLNGRLNDGHKRIITQCIQSKQLKSNKNRSIVYKMLIQIIKKAGYPPWNVKFNWNSISNNNVMLIGMDVCHKRKAKSSIVGFVSTYDKALTQCHLQICKQKMGVELVQNIDILFKNSLKYYYSKRNAYPNIIIFYRDGVSFNQLDTVKDKEIPKLKELFNGKLIFIVVQKRVETRLYNQNSNKNEYISCHEGTIVDTHIVSQRYSDYYLVSTTAPKGKTAIPTRYLVINDDLNVNKRILQQFSYELCSLYFNWEKSIKVPSVVKLADHICGKYSFGNFIHKLFKENDIVDVDHITITNDDEKENNNYNNYNNSIKNVKANTRIEHEMKESNEETNDTNNDDTNENNSDSESDSPLFVPFSYE